MFMLDTNIIIYAIKNNPKTVIANMSKHKPKDICISSITYAELVYGVEKSKSVEKNWIVLSLMLSNIEVKQFDNLAAEEYGRIRDRLEKDGRVIGPLDMLIAAHAKSQNCILVTNNTREFKRVKDLKIENWT